MTRIGIVSLTQQTSLEHSADPHCGDLLALIGYLQKLGYSITQVYSEWYTKELGFGTNKYLLRKSASAYQLAQDFDLVVIPPQVAISESVEKASQLLPSVSSMLEQLACFGEVWHFNNDFRPRRIALHDELLVHGIKAKLKHTGTVGEGGMLGQLYPYLIGTTPGPWLDGAELLATGDQLDCIFAAIQMDGSRELMLDKYCNYSLLSGLGYYEMKQELARSRTAFVQLDEYNLAQGVIATARFCQALLWASHLVIPVEYKSLYESWLSPEILGMCIVKDKADWQAIANIWGTSPSYRIMYREQIKQFLWSILC